MNKKALNRKVNASVMLAIALALVTSSSFGPALSDAVLPDLGVDAAEPAPVPIRDAVKDQADVFAGVGLAAGQQVGSEGSESLLPTGLAAGTGALGDNPWRSAATGEQPRPPVGGADSDTSSAGRYGTRALNSRLRSPGTTGRVGLLLIGGSGSRDDGSRDGGSLVPRDGASALPDDGAGTLPTPVSQVGSGDPSKVNVPATISLLALGLAFWLPAIADASTLHHKSGPSGRFSAAPAHAPRDSGPDAESSGAYG